MSELETFKNNEVAKGKLKVIDVEKAIQQKLTEDWVEPEYSTTHQFFGGIYVRVLKMPKDTLMTGARHRFSTCNILLEGSLSVFMEDGTGVRKMEAPCIFESEKHIKKLIYCHEDVTFVTVHPSKETDIKKLESFFTISEEEYAGVNQ